MFELCPTMFSTPVHLSKVGRDDADKWSHRARRRPVADHTRDPAARPPRPTPPRPGRGQLRRAVMSSSAQTGASPSRVSATPLSAVLVAEYFPPSQPGRRPLRCAMRPARDPPEDGDTMADPEVRSDVDILIRLQAASD